MAREEMKPFFFNEAWRCTRDDNRARLFEIAELAAAFRGTSEFALESSQQASACNLDASARVARSAPGRTFAMAFRSACSARPIRRTWSSLCKGGHPPVGLALPAYLQSYLANLVTTGVRLIPLGQTDGQLAIAALEGERYSPPALKP